MMAHHKFARKLQAGATFTVILGTHATSVGLNSFDPRFRTHCPPPAARLALPACSETSRVVHPSAVYSVHPRAQTHPRLPSRQLQLIRSTHEPQHFGITQV